jgi:flagellar hook protein FlgE
LQATTTTRVINASGNPQNIVNDFNDAFSTNPKYPADTETNPVATYTKYSPHPGVYAMKSDAQSARFVKVAEDSNGTVWRWYAADGSNINEANPDPQKVGQGTGLLRFDTDGKLIHSTTDSGAAVNFDFSRMTQVAGADSAADAGGIIYGKFTNGETFLLAQVGLAAVMNPQGLDGANGTMFQANMISGETVYSAPGGYSNNPLNSAGTSFGAAHPGYLEQSNYELGAQSILTQRAYQFSSRLVTTANEMLQTAYNLK